MAAAEQEPRAPPGHAAEVDLTGLTTAEARELLERFGPNEIPEKQVSTFEMVLKQFTGAHAALCPGAHSITSRLSAFSSRLGLSVTPLWLSLSLSHTYPNLVKAPCPS